MVLLIFMKTDQSDEMSLRGLHSRLCVAMRSALLVF